MSNQNYIDKCSEVSGEIKWYVPFKEQLEWRKYAGKRMVSFIRSFFINTGFMARTKTDTHPVTGEELDNE